MSSVFSPPGIEAGLEIDVGTRDLQLLTPIVDLYEAHMRFFEEHPIHPEFKPLRWDPDVALDFFGCKWVTQTYQSAKSFLAQHAKPAFGQGMSAYWVELIVSSYSQPWYYRCSCDSGQPGQ